MTLVSAAIWILLGLQFFLILCLVLLLSLMISAIMTVPWVPTFRKTGRRMFELVGLKPGERVVDFGCGDGSLLITAAKEFGATGIGYEIHPALVWYARFRARLAGVSAQVEFRRGDFFKMNWPDADVIALYLFSEVQAKMEPLILKRYSPATRVVARTFAFPTLPLVNSEKAHGEMIRVYAISKKA